MVSNIINKRFNNLPVHTTDSIAFVLYITILAIITISGMALGYPNVLWVWAVPFFTGWESSECNCDQCTDTEPSPKEIISRKYVNGEITDQEIDEKIERIEKIREMDENRLEKSFN